MTDTLNRTGRSLVLALCLVALFASSAQAGTTVLAPNCFQILDPDTGSPEAGGKISVFLSGTSTPTSAYTDATGTVALANPAIADGSGVICMWLDPATAVKLVVKQSDDSVIRTIDGVNTAVAGSFTTLSASGAVTFSSTLSVGDVLTSLVGTGTAPIVLNSSTKIDNANADLLDDGDWAAPPVGVGSGTRTPGTSKFTTLDVSGNSTLTGNVAVTGTTALTGALTESACTGTLQTATGATWVRGCVSELVTIGAAATTDSVATLLPANSIIESVVVRTVTLIPTAATYTVGTAAQASRFATGVSTAAGSTAVGILQWNPAVATDDLGPRQVAAAAVRITPNAVPGAATGQIRITVFYSTFVAPQS